MGQEKGEKADNTTMTFLTVKNKIMRNDAFRKTVPFHVC